MDPLLIPCPKCGKRLKLRDRTLLGKVGQCPACGERFRLEEQAPETLEIAPLAVAPPPSVPTRVATIATEPVPEPESGLPDFRALDERDDARSGAGASADPIDDVRRQMARRKTRRAKQQGLLLIAASVIVAGLVGGYLLVVRPSQARQASQDVAATLPVDSPPPANPANTATPADVRSPPKQKAEPAQPITLRSIPAGVRIVVNLHPAAWWNDTPRSQEYLACLGPVAEWGAAQLRELCRCEPGQIASALVCVIPGERGAPPSVAGVFELTESANLIEQLGVERSSDFSKPVYVRDDRAYVIEGGQTFATAPLALAQEMLDAEANPIPTTTSLDQLLRHSNARNPFTMACDLQTFELHGDTLLPADDRARRLAHAAFDWFGPDAEAIAWSVSMDEGMSSTFDIAAARSTPLSEFQSTLHGLVQMLPMEILTRVERMYPRTAGRRQVVGRLPAMTQTAVLETEESQVDGLVRLSTRLPERAFPNLVLAIRLATDDLDTVSGKSGASSRPTPAVATSVPSNAQPLSARLSKPINVDFRRAPLQEVCEFLAGEIDATIEIDGEALKMAGYTKNMPQTIALEQTPAAAVFAQILKPYDKLSLVADDARNVLILTTKDEAAKKNLTPLTLAP